MVCISYLHQSERFVREGIHTVVIVEVYPQLLVDAPLLHDVGWLNENIMDHLAK